MTYCDLARRSGILGHLEVLPKCLHGRNPETKCGHHAVQAMWEEGDNGKADQSGSGEGYQF